MNISPGKAKGFGPRTERSSSWRVHLPDDSVIRLFARFVYVHPSRFEATVWSPDGRTTRGEGRCVQTADADAAWYWLRQHAAGARLEYVPASKTDEESR